MFGSNLFAGSPFGSVEFFSVLINVSEPIVDVFEGDTIAEPIIVVEDALTLQPLPIDPNIIETSSITEDTVLLLKSNIGVNDATTITDLPVFYPDLVFVRDAPQVSVLSGSNLFDTVTTSEFVSAVVFPPLLTETVTVTELTIVSTGAFKENLFELVTVSDVVTVAFPIEEGNLIQIDTLDS